MGEYRNGKWTPTFGDEQFGVVDRPGEMYNRVRELEAKIERLEAALEEIAERDPLESISASIARAALKGMDAYPNTLRDLEDDK